LRANVLVELYTCRLLVLKIIVHYIAHLFEMLLYLIIISFKSGGNAENSATQKMRPNSIGQIVKYHTPYPNEVPNQKYVISEIHFDVEKPRAMIKELNGGKALASIMTVLVDDLEVVEVDASGLLNHQVTINKVDYSQAIGKVCKVSKQEIILDLNKGVKGVETNLWLTIIDERGTEHTGTLFVN